MIDLKNNRDKRSLVDQWLPQGNRILGPGCSLSVVPGFVEPFSGSFVISRGLSVLPVILLASSRAVKSEGRIAEKCSFSLKELFQC